MRRAVRIAVAAGVLVASVGIAVADPRESKVVATVGSDAITVGEVEALLAKVRAYRLRELGKTDDEIRRRVLEEMIELRLMVQAAKADELDQREDVRSRIQGVLVQALEQQLREQALASTEVSDAAVKRYYEEQRDRYRSQCRLRLWQIVVGTREEAKRIIEQMASDEARKNPTGVWEKLALERSLDKSTSQRKGDLGFVQEDGSTKNKQHRVAPALYRAAAKVDDGEVVPEPLQDGERWVVLRRSGSITTPERPLESEAPAIRAILSKQQVSARLEAMIAELREKYVRELHVERLNHVRIDPDGEVGPQRRPGGLRRARPAAKPGKPTGEPGELR